MKSVFRFIDFLGFVNLVQNKKLVFVKPDLWDDPFENYFFKKLETRKGQEEIYNIMKGLGVEKIHEKIINLCCAKNSVFGQSWSLISESDALWRIYGKNNHCIRIEVDLKKIEEISKRNKSFWYAPVKYRDNISLENEILKILKKDEINDFCVKGLVVKRASFSHEKEFRLFYSEKEEVSNYMNSIFSNEIEKIKSGDFDNDYFYSLLEKINRVPVSSDEIKKISIENPSEFISSVILHPQAEDWVDKTVRDYCKINNINYLGKSKLYEFE